MTAFNHTPEEARILVAEVLESGDYEQGKMLLEASDGKMCCLGVACRLFRAHESDYDLPVDAQHGVTATRFGIEGNSMSLPMVVQEWLGLRGSEGEFDPDYAIPAIPSASHSHTLSGLNDGGMSFDEIAKLFRHPPVGMIVDPEDIVPTSENDRDGETVLGFN